VAAWRDAGFGGALCFERSRPRLLAAGPLGCVRSWDTTTWAEDPPFKAHPADLLGQALSPDGSTLVTVATDGTARLWPWPPDEAATAGAPAAVPQPLRTLPCPCNGRALVSYLAGERLLVASACSVLLADATGRTTPGPCPTKDLLDVAHGMAATADGSRAAIVSVSPALHQHRLTLFDVAHWTARNVVHGTPEAHGMTLTARGPSACAFTPDGALFALAHLDGTLELRAAEDGAVERTGSVLRHAEVLAFSPDCLTLAVGDLLGAVALFDVATLTERLRWAAPCGTVALAFSPDSTLLAAALRGSGVVVWRL